MKKVVAQNKMKNDNYKKLGEAIGFPPKKLSLLEQALTHPTYFEGVRSEDSCNNQRLEFLGDAVLDFLVGEYLFWKYRQAQEGDLTKMRSVIVCEASLAKKSQELGIGEALLLGKGSDVSGDRQRPSVLGDAFEAVLGAIYAAQGIEVAREFILKHFQEEMDSLQKDDYEDKKSLLQELVQKNSSKGVHYRLLSSSGPDHAPVFESGAYCGTLLLGSGSGSSKKESEIAAAKAAFANQDDWLEEIRQLYSR